MTVQTETNKIVYDGLIGQTVFAYNFRVDQKEDMNVYLGGVIIAQGDWTIDGIGGDFGGNVTLNTPLGSDQTVTLLREVAATQLVDYQPFDAFPAEVNEQALDKLTMIVQQLQEFINRTPIPPPDSEPGSGDYLVDGDLIVTGTSTLIGGASSPVAPVGPNDLTNKAYVDGGIPTETSESIIKDNAALDRIRLFQSGAITVRRVPYGFLDAYQNTAGIDEGASSNNNYDSVRTAYVPTRSQAATINTDPFDSLAAWTDISSGTGAANIVASGSSDPAVGGNGVELTSGGTIGGIGAIEQDVGTIPNAKFGVMFISTLENVGVAGANALEITLETDGNQMMYIRQRDGAFEVFADGAWQLIFARGGNFSTEWWVNAFDLGNGDHKIDVYAGAENVGTYTGVLPAGTVDGRVTYKQMSGAANMRVSQVWIQQVGITQLSDNLEIISEPFEALSEPSQGRLSILLEDVSNVVNVNINFNASVSKDDGATWELLTLVDQGVMELGEIDTTKPVYFFTSSHLFTTTGDQTMRYKINETANQFIAIQGVDMQWE